jgi:plastocyanin
MKSVFVITAAAALIASIALADEPPVFTLAIKDHAFNPATIEVPADTKVRLQVKNLDNTPEEFESEDFKREKVIPGNSEVTIFVGPFSPGEYSFKGEYHENTAKGKLIVK